MTLEEWKNDFKGFINELSMPKDDYNGIMEYIDEVPVTSQPKTGHWINDMGTSQEWSFNQPFKCSCCGGRFIYSPFCPHCGEKKMIEPQEGGDKE